MDKNLKFSDQADTGSYVKATNKISGYKVLKRFLFYEIYLDFSFTLSTEKHKLWWCLNVLYCTVSLQY